MVWVGAGSDTHMAAMHPSVLVRLARAQPMDAVEDSDIRFQLREEKLDA